MNGMDDVLRRFHRVLVEEITARRPEYLDGPFTVAEIYQNLVPYGTHRDRIGVEMNGDYEDALLRLLAGEGGYLQLDSEHALRELREELETSNPNTGLYRDFAAVDVRLLRTDIEGEEGETGDLWAGSAAYGDEDPLSIHDLAPEEPQGASPQDEAAVDAFSKPGTDPDAPLPSSGAEAGPEAEVAPSTSGPVDGPAADPASSPSAATPDTCPWCRASLPSRPNLNFCPFCGTDVHLVPCPGCGEELEPEWRFCISCGTEVAG